MKEVRWQKIEFERIGTRHFIERAGSSTVVRPDRSRLKDGLSAFGYLLNFLSILN
jgi:hypothetical protein